MHFLAFGIGVGAGIQAWRNWPADGPTSTSMGFVVTVAAVLLAYFGGRRRRPAAVAVASAHAEAVSTSQVNLAVVVPGAGHSRIGATAPEPGAVSWMGHERAQVTANDLDGLDLEELGVVADRDPADPLTS